MSINIPTPKKFTCKLTMSGLDVIRHNYTVSSSTSALGLSVGLINTFTKDFVNDDRYNLQYDIAIALLSKLTNINIGQIEKDLKKTPQELIARWKLIEDTNEKRN